MTSARLGRSTIAALVVLASSGCGSGAETPSATSDQASTSDGPNRGQTFVDPEGTYTITIDPAWTKMPGVFVKEVESWVVAPASNGVAPNVNVLTQDAAGADLDEYLAFSVRNMAGFELIEQTTASGSNGNELGVLEYAGVAPGGPAEPLHFLATVDVHDGVAVVATLTTDEASFEAHRADVERYLLTLQAT